jgi:hypothetical protein
MIWWLKSLLFLVTKLLQPSSTSLAIFQLEFEEGLEVEVVLLTKLNSRTLEVDSG